MLAQMVPRPRLSSVCIPESRYHRNGSARDGEHDGVQHKDGEVEEDLSKDDDGRKEVGKGVVEERSGHNDGENEGDDTSSAEKKP